MNSKKIPKISILTVTYNAERLIEKTIQSVLMQDFKDLEYLVIDGGSTDKTLVLLNKYNINYVSEPDEGVSDAFNKGISKAKGEYILFLNAGDYFSDKGVLRSVFSIDLGADVVYGKVLVSFDRNGHHIESIHGSIKLPLNKLPTVHQGMIFTRNTFDQLGAFDKRYKYAMDYDHYHRIRNKVSFQFVDRILIERPMDKNRNSFGNPASTWLEYVKIDYKYKNIYFFSSLIKFFYYKVKMIQNLRNIFRKYNLNQ